MHCARGAGSKKKEKKKTQMQELDANAGNPITHLVPQNSNFEINLRKFQVIINFFLKFNVLSSFNTLIFFFSICPSPREIIIYF